MEENTHTAFKETLRIYYHLAITKNEQELWYTVQIPDCEATVVMNLYANH